MSKSASTRSLKIAAATLAGGLLLFKLTRPAPDAPSRAMTPEPAPAFLLPDVKGKPLSLSAFKGQVVLVDFWATWCGPCLSELPDLVALHEKLKGRGFTVLGLSMDEETAAVKPFLEDNAVPYPILLTGGEPPPGYPVYGIPTAFLIDRGGMIVREYMGPKNLAQLSADIEPYLLK